MAKRISLSRAARLVGVKRGTLQQQIRAGELKTFEGEIVLADTHRGAPGRTCTGQSMQAQRPKITRSLPSSASSGESFDR